MKQRAVGLAEVSVCFLISKVVGVTPEEFLHRLRGFSPNPRLVKLVSAYGQ
jgi:hypothetical protein